MKGRVLGVKRICSLLSRSPHPKGEAKRPQECKHKQGTLGRRVRREWFWGEAGRILGMKTLNCFRKKGWRKGQTGRTF